MRPRDHRPACRMASGTPGAQRSEHAGARGMRRRCAAHGSQCRLRVITTSGLATSLRRLLFVHAALAIVLSPIGALAQTPGAPPPPPAPETPTDRLGRTTPRGTVEGFLGAARRGEDDLARQYLNTRQTGEAAAALARKLFVVLDRRMQGVPQPSDAPEGSRSNPDSPGLEIIGSGESRW